MIRSLVFKKAQKTPSGTQGIHFIESELIFQFFEAASVSNLNLTIPLVGIRVGKGCNLLKLRG